MFDRLLGFPHFLLEAVIGRLTCGAPRYEPTLWGPAAEVQYNNNCYNYACDMPGTYAQPGVASGYEYRTLTCEEIGQAIIADGLVRVDCTKRCGRSSHKVALVISPGQSF